MTEQRMVDVELILSSVEMLEEDLPYMNISLAPKELPVVQLIDKLRDIIASPSVGWQPIETAPKDGDVLLYCPKRGVVRGKWDECRYASNPKPYWSHDRERIFGIRETRDDQPTHWMPLPQPPRED